MRVVHHLENSRSQRLLWLLEEMGLPYEVKRYARDPRTMRAPPELKRVHPLGRSPLLDEDGGIYAESAAIIEHLVALTGKFGPPHDPDAQRRFHMFLHYAESSLMPLLLSLLVIARRWFFGRPAPKPLLGRIDARPAYQRALVTGGPYAYA